MHIGPVVVRASGKPPCRGGAARLPAGNQSARPPLYAVGFCHRVCPRGRAPSLRPVGLQVSHRDRPNLRRGIRNWVSRREDSVGGFMTRRCCHLVVGVMVRQCVACASSCGWRKQFEAEPGGRDSSVDFLPIQKDGGFPYAGVRPVARLTGSCITDRLLPRSPQADTACPTARLMLTAAFTSACAV
jgi:hypothetical protein